MSAPQSLCDALHIQASAAENVLTRYLSGSSVSREEMYAVRDGLQVTLNALSKETPAGQPSRPYEDETTAADYCPHGYVWPTAPHPAAGLETCPEGCPTHD